MSASLRSDATTLDAVAGLLGPEDVATGPTRTYAVLPRPSRPRYIVPVEGRFARGAHVRPGASGRDALVRAGLRRALALGAGRLLPGAVRVADGTASRPGLRRHLGTLLGRDDLDVAIALGAPRPNRKPVLQVVAGDGTTVAWAKLGVDEHTDRLVAHETEALARVDRGGPLVAPSVAAAGTWHGHRLLVLEPLEMSESMEELALTAAVVRAIAGPLREEEAAASRWLRTLCDGAARADAQGGAGGRALTAMLERLARDLGGARWSFGSWHGDLAPWNATWEGDRLHVWDWERSTGPVPLGIDAVHNRFQLKVLVGADPTDAAAATAREDAPLLQELGYPADQVPLVVRAYLATLRLRYADDARLGSLGPGARIAAAIDRDPALGLEATA